MGALMADLREELEDVVWRVTPETVLEAMGIAYKLRWEGRRSWNEWTDKEAHVVRMMHGPLTEIGSKAAVRVCRRPEWPSDASPAQREALALKYLRTLVAARDRFVRRAWRRLSPMAC